MQSLLKRYPGNAWVTLWLWSSRVHVIDFCPFLVLLQMHGGGLIFWGVFVLFYQSSSPGNSMFVSCTFQHRNPSLCWVSRSLAVLTFPHQHHHWELPIPVQWSWGNSGCSGPFRKPLSVSQGPASPSHGFEEQEHFSSVLANNWESFVHKGLKEIGIWLAGQQLLMQRAKAVLCRQECFGVPGREGSLALGIFAFQTHHGWVPAVWTGTHSVFLDTNPAVTHLVEVSLSAVRPQCPHCCSWVEIIPPAQQRFQEAVCILCELQNTGAAMADRICIYRGKPSQLFNKLLSPHPLTTAHLIWKNPTASTLLTSILQSCNSIYLSSCGLFTHNIKIMLLHSV